MRIAVTGGKGGTGKSLIATSLTNALQEKNKVLLVDADVECPNDHLLLSIKRKELKKVFQPRPVFDYSKCVKCGKCASVCKEKSILFVKDKYPVFIPEQCNGCQACIIACPQGAISKGRQEIGTLYSADGFLSGELREGVEESSPVVNALKKEIKRGYDYEIIDTAAGAHCNVISALIGCDLALVVAEPTPFSAHDAGLMLELLEKLGVPSVMVLNKSTIGDRKLIYDLGQQVIAEIPYSKEIITSYSQGEPVNGSWLAKIIAFLGAQ